MVYDSLKVNVIVNGIIVTGFAEGTMVTCERNEDRVVPYIGVKGEWGYSYNNNNTGTITIQLQQGSPANATLQRLANSKTEFSINVTDVNTDGGFRAGGNNAIILLEPSNERGAEITSRTWSIYVFNYSCVDG